MNSLSLIAVIIAVASVFVSAGSGACGAPAYWEVHKTYSDIALAGGLVLAGIIVAILSFAYLGLSSKSGKPALALGILLVIAGAYLFVSGPPYIAELAPFGNAGSTHEHADFAVFINGVQWNFSQDKYMTLETGIPKSGLTHLHDGFGTVLHKHATGVTFAYFLKTIGWKLTDSCIETDLNQTYCNDGKSTLQVFVNGRLLNGPISSYSPSDLDKVLIAYGQYNTDEVKSMQSHLTNYSCIYSKTCAAPAGFVLPPENCAVGGS